MMCMVIVTITEGCEISIVTSGLQRCTIIMVMCTVLSLAPAVHYSSLGHSHFTRSAFGL